MKLQIESPLIRTVRESQPHRIPENLILKILIFGCVVMVALTVQTALILPFLAKDLLALMKEMYSGGGTPDINAFTERLTAIAGNSKYVIPSLFATIGTTLTVLLWCRFGEGRKLRTLGFVKEHAFPQYLIGLLAGFVTFSAIVGVAVVFGGVEFTGFKGQFTLPLLLTFVGFLLQGMSEEVVCRGFMMTSTLRHHNIWWAIGVNSVVFAVMHSFNNGLSLFALLNLILSGVTFSLYMLRTGSIWGACAFHSIWNFVQGNFYGLPVSGISAGDTVFSFGFKGSALVNGGDFGLEAGIAATIVLSIWIVCLLFVPNPFAKKQPAPAAEQQA